MAYDGGYGGQQRPYAGAAAQRPVPRGYGGGPPPQQQQQQQQQQHQQYDDYQDGYAYDGYGGGSGHGQEHGGHYQEASHGRPPPQQGYFDPNMGRGGRPPPGGSRGGRGGGGGGGGGPMGRPPTADGRRGGPYPPRGGGGMGPGPGPGPGHGRGGRPGPPPANAGPPQRRPPMNNGPVSPPVDGPYGQYPGPERMSQNQDYQMANQMAGMDLNGQGSRGPSAVRASVDSQRNQGEYGRPPMSAGRGQQPRGYPPADSYSDPRHGPPGGPGGQAPNNDYANFDDGYGPVSQAPPQHNFAPPARSMTMPAHESGGYDLPSPQQMNPNPTSYQDPPAHYVPQRPATAAGNRPIPHRTYPAPADTQQPPQPPQPQQPQQGQYGGGYQNHTGYGQEQTTAVDDLFDSYYDTPGSNNPEYGAPAQPNRSSLPNFDAIPAQRRGSFEETMRPGAEQTQPGAHGTPKLQHAKSMANVREPQSAVFEMAGDIPSVPPVPQSASYQPAYDQGYGAPAAPGGPAGYGGPAAQGAPAGYGGQVGYGAPVGYDQMPPRGPSAPPGSGGYRNVQRPGLPGNTSMIRPGQGVAPNRTMDGMPSHPTPVRPGLMPNSMVNMNDKPPPVRNYGGIPQQVPEPMQYQQPPPQHQQQQPQQQQGGPPAQQVAKAPDVPVTPQELERLRMTIKTNPNDQESALRLAKRLIEAADVLVSSLPDPKARARGRERYLMDAQKVLKKLCGLQNQEAMFIMADSLGRGLFGNEPDNKDAFTLYQSAAKLGNAAAAYRTAVCCEIGHEEGGGTRKDPLKAIQWYKRAATLGDPPAMYKVGMILLKGLLGQPRNVREAVVWLRRAADRADADNPHSLHELGLLYESASPNDSIIKDEQYALSLFEQAAELGYKFSQFRLGCVYEYGWMGRPIDPRLSIVWYSRAAQQEEHQSELALSGWYLTGSEGVLGQSDTEAYLWARKAAVAGLAKAEYAMGYFTETGIGIAANLEDAKRWYWRAAAQNFPKARERLEDLKRVGKGSGPRQRERISRSGIEKQDGDCTIM